MTIGSFSHCEQLLNDAIADGLIPGAAAAVGVRSQVLWQYAGGHAQIQGGTPHPMTITTWFDVASLTKVMATLPALLKLASEGRLSFGDPVTRFFPDWEAHWGQVTLRHLLTHTAGLVPHRDYYVTLRGKDQYLAAIQAEPWEHRPGETVQYSDLGFILLGAVVEAVSNTPLDRFITQEVLAPMGIREAVFCPDDPIRSQCAATEVVDGQALKSLVHDENARAMGGVAGHAGLFATLQAVSQYAAVWASGDDTILPAVIRDACTRLQTANLGGQRGLGWVLSGDPYDVSGDFWPATGAGHTGFTGTSIQFDRLSGVWAVLLTNRVHFGRGVNISPLRRRFHNLVMSVLSRGT